MAVVLQLSDIHHPAAQGERVFGLDTAERLLRVIASATEVAPRVDLVVLSGDQTHHGGEESNQAVRDVVAALDAPILALRGNHDELVPHSRVFGDSKEAEVGGWRVLAVDTAVAGEDYGRIDVAALMARLDARDERPTLLAVHHPPVPPTAHPSFRLEGAQALLDALLRRPHLKAVISGHVHAPFERGRRGLKLLGCPPTSVNVTHTAAGLELAPERPVGARLLVLTPRPSVHTTIAWHRLTPSFAAGMTVAMPKAD